MSIWKAPTLTDRPILVFGATAIGRRIACTWISAGFNVNIQDANLKDRAEAVQYVIEHVAAYMNRIGRTKKGIITASANLDTTNASNPWLVIEAIPDFWTAQECTTLKTDLFGDLDAALPEDCLFCVNVMKHFGIFKKVRRTSRVLILHHYLIPNARVIEVVKNKYTDQAIVDFLFDVIPSTGALPIVAKEETSAQTFHKVWEALKQEVLDMLDKNVDATAIDKGWENILRHSSTDDLDVWFDNLGHEFDDLIERNYATKNELGGTILSHLKEVLSEEGKLAPFSPYDGLELRPHGLVANLSKPFQRAGPDIYFVDIGRLEDSKVDYGRILRGSTDGTIRTVVSDLRLPYGLAIHYASKRIFWSDLADGTITSCTFAGRSIRTIVPRDDRAAPKQLAVDQTKSQMYWTQSEGTQILRCNTDGTCIEALIETNSSSTMNRSNQPTWPNGITLDSSRRHFYWSQRSHSNPSKYRIQRASMDLSSGSTPFQREDIETVFDDLPEILDIDFVPVFDELYWSAKGEGTEIHRGYVGTCVNADMETQDIVVGDLKGMGWIKVDPKAGHVYTTCLRGLLTRFDMTTGEGESRLYRDEDGTFAGIALVYGGSGSEAVMDEDEDEDRGEGEEAKIVCHGMDGADEPRQASLCSESIAMDTDVSTDADTDVKVELAIRSVEPETDAIDVVMEDG